MPLNFHLLSHLYYFIYYLIYNLNYNSERVLLFINSLMYLFLTFSFLFETLLNT